MTRRTLLAGFAPAVCPARRVAPRWRLSTSSIHFRTLPVERACQAVRQAGYSAIDFWPSSFKCPHLDEIETRLGADGLKAVLRKNHLTLAAFTCYNISSTRYAGLLGRFGGGLVVRESKYGRVANLRQEMAAFLESLKPDLASAEENNYRLAIENHGAALLDSLDSIRAFVEMARHPRLGIALAPYHLQAAGIPVEDAVRAAGNRLLFFYAWQKGACLSQLPGIGPADFRPWLDALTEVGYEGCVNAFMHGEEPFETMSESLAKSKQYLDTLCKAQRS